MPQTKYMAGEFVYLDSSSRKSGSSEWLLPAPPQDGESLHSWFTRTAHENTVSTSFFLSRFLGTSHNVDLDTTVLRQEFIDRMVSKTDVTREQIASMNLRRWEEKLPASCFSTRKSMYIIRNGAARFCPECLSNDNVPYYRLLWRLWFVTACQEHRCVLSNRCPKCNTHVAFHQNA